MPDPEKEQETTETVDQDQITDEAPDQDQETENFDKDRAVETIRKQRESEKKLAKDLKDAKTKLKAFEDEEKKRKDADLSELQKAQGRVEELEASLQEAQTLTQALRLQQAFRSEVEKLELKFASAQAAEDAFELADMEDVEIGADGKITGLDDAIKALQKSRPYLFAATETDGKGTPKRTKPGGTERQTTEVVTPKIRL